MKVTRVGMIGIAIAAGVLTFIIVLILRTVQSSSETANELKRKLDATPPASTQDVRDIDRKISEIQTTLPPIIVTVAPGHPVVGPPGPAGPPGPPGDPGTPGPSGAPGTTKIIRQAVQPNARSTPAPSPTPQSCVLNGLVRIGTVC